MEAAARNSSGDISLFTHKHPVDGKVELRLSGGIVHASCRWPLDLDANEWATIAGDFPLEDFRIAVQHLENQGRGRTLSLRDRGFLEFVDTSKGTRLELGNDTPPAARLSLNLTEPAAQLAQRLLANLDDATAIPPSRRPD